MAHLSVWIASFLAAVFGGFYLFYLVPGVFLALLCTGAWAFLWGALANWALRTEKRPR